MKRSTTHRFWLGWEKLTPGYAILLLAILLPEALQLLGLASQAADTRSQSKVEPTGRV